MTNPSQITDVLQWVEQLQKSLLSNANSADIQNGIWVIQAMRDHLSFQHQLCNRTDLFEDDFLLTNHALESLGHHLNNNRVLPLLTAELFMEFVSARFKELIGLLPQDRTKVAINTDEPASISGGEFL